MKSNFFFLVFLLLMLNLFQLSSQTSDLDEIEKAKKTLIDYFKNNKTDSNVKLTYSKLREYYTYYNPEEGIRFYYSILNDSNLTLNESNKIMLYSGIAYLYKSLQQFEISAKYFFLAVDLAKKNNDLLTLALINIDFGNLLFAYHQYQKAISLYKEAISLLNEQLKNLKLTKWEVTNIQHNLAVASENVGLCYQNLKNYDSALFYVRKSEKFRLSPSIPKINQQYYYKTLGALYWEMGKLDSAIHYSKLSFNFDPSKSITKVDTPEYINFRAQAELTLGQAYLSKNMKDSGFHYFERSINTISNLKNVPMIIRHYYLVSSFLEGKGYLDKSLSYLNMARKLIAQYPQFRSQAIDIDLLIAKIYSQRGMYRKAKELQDSIITNLISQIFETNEKKLHYAQLDIELQNKIKDIEIIQIEKTYKEQKLKDQQIIVALLIVLAIFLTMLVALVFYFYERKKHAAMLLGKKNVELTDLNIKIQNALNLTEKLNIELENSQKELLASNLELEESNRTKNTLFSVIAHDLKNSIGGIKNTALLLFVENENLTDIEKFELSKLLKESTENLYILLENLLLWAASQNKKIKPKKSLNQPYEVANIVCAILSDYAKSKNIKIENQIAQDLYFEFDPSLLQIIFQNLIYNSLKYCNENGEIVVSGTKQNNEILFCVSDNGVGMSVEKAQKLFSQVRADSSYGTKGEKGTGLGLSIVAEFVKLHNGKIWVESQEGIGTKIYFTFEYLNESENLEENP
ncbi:MAG: HAMP domain-containing histidine kinase [Ignavibacteria bacterium]|nr:HAMP domain-containing histidine kinase [Ignavibacteria bacterium]